MISLCIYDRNKTNNPILNLTPENITQHSRIDRTLVISSEDMEPTTFNSLRKATIAIGVGVIRYVRNNERDFRKDKNSKVFFIKWC